MRRAAAAGPVWALAAALLMIAPAAAGARIHDAATRDSLRASRSLVIDGNGVSIRARGDVADRVSHDVRARIERNLERRRAVMRARGDSSGHTFGFVGPGIRVDTDDAALVRVFEDADVPAGKRVEGDVVAVFGSVTVEGSVTGDVVAVFGSVKLAPGAAVDGDAVAVGGVLDQARGATVGGESVSLGVFPIAWGIPTMPVLLLAVLICLLVTLFMAWLVSLLAPRRMLRIAVTASRRGTASFFLGLVSTPLMLFAAILLCVTVIGVPIAGLLVLFYPLAVWVGQIAATYVLGSRLLRRRLGQGGPMTPIVAGGLFVALFFFMSALLATPPGFARTAALFFLLLGSLLVFCLSAIGTGALLLSRLGGRPADAVFEQPAGATPAPGPSMGAIPAPPAAGA